MLIEITKERCEEIVATLNRVEKEEMSDPKVTKTRQAFWRLLGYFDAIKEEIEIHDKNYNYTTKLDQE